MFDDFTTQIQCEEVYDEEMWEWFQQFFEEDDEDLAP